MTAPPGVTEGRRGGSDSVGGRRESAGGGDRGDCGEDSGADEHLGELLGWVRPSVCV